MIKKTILVFALLFVLYTGFVLFFASDRCKASQHQWQDNLIKAQNFLYNDRDTFQNVIVGSSLANRLVMDSIPKTYNLSFQGESIYDGLNILAHKKNNFKNIFIEMNFVFRDENENFTSSLFSPIMFSMRKYIPSLREDRQPLAVLGSLITSAFKNLKSLVHSDKQVFEKDEVQEKQEISSDLFEKALQIQKDIFSKVPDKNTVDAHFKKLKERISKLEQDGISIIFFEIPVNFQLENLPLANVSRNSFYKYFPVTVYKYISMPVSDKFQTSDGLHLRNDEALKYTLYFSSEVKKYMN